MVVELYVEAEGTDVGGVAHEGGEGKDGGVGVGDEAAGFVGFDGRFFEVVEIVMEAGDVVGVVAGGGSEVVFEIGDALLEGESVEPLAADAGVVGIKLVGEGELGCSAAVHGGEAEIAGCEKMGARLAGVELLGCGGGGSYEPEGALTVLDLAESGLEDGGLRLRDEGLLDEVVGVGELLLA